MIYNSFYWLKNYLSVFHSKILLLFGIKHDKSVIPTGLYCYKPDYEKNKTNKSSTTYYIIPCPYYKSLGGGRNGCKYLGVITSDTVFGDQCKMCGENYSK